MGKIQFIVISGMGSSYRDECRDVLQEDGVVFSVLVYETLRLWFESRFYGISVFSVFYKTIHQ